MFLRKICIRILQVLSQNSLSNSDFVEMISWCLALDTIYDTSIGFIFSNASALSYNFKHIYTNLSFASKFIKLNAWIICVQSWKLILSSLNSNINFLSIADQNSRLPFLEWLYLWVIIARFFVSRKSACSLRIIYSYWVQIWG